MSLNTNGNMRLLAKLLRTPMGRKTLREQFEYQSDGNAGTICILLDIVDEYAALAFPDRSPTVSRADQGPEKPE